MRLLPYLGAAALGLVASSALAGNIPNQYIVTLAKPADGSALAALPVAGQAQQLLTSVGGGKILFTYEHALRGFSVRMGPAQAALLAANPMVKTVNPDVEVKAVATQSNPPSYGINRIDQRSLPLDSSYNYPDLAGQGAHVYVIDTGINPNHSEFTGRVGTSRNFVGGGLLGTGSVDASAWTDCNGHGTHVSGTAVGTLYGVAKKATIHAVRVLDCNGSGSGSAILAGIDWVIQNHQSPAVANLSLGTLNGRSTDQENAVKALVNANVAVAVAAGNDSKDACTTSPAAEPAVLTTGATDNADKQASYSNFGTCVDLYAPGTNIISADYSNNSGNTTLSGTSMASPHVAGALALLRAANPGTTAAAVQTQLVADTSSGKVIGAGSGSPNKLLYVVNGGSTPPPTVDNPPVASFTSSCTNLTCSFASTSTDDKGIAATAWTFGDGSSANGVNVSRTYAAAGTYTVTLTVTDTTSQTNSKSQSVTVTTAPPPPSGPCSDCTVKSGTLASGGTAYDPSSSGFTSNGGQFKGYLRGAAGTDFDLYLEKYSSGLLGGWSSVQSGETTSSSEDVIYTGSAGTYRWRITSYSGAGSYSFYVKNP